MVKFWIGRNSIIQTMLKCGPVSALSIRVVWWVENGRMTHCVDHLKQTTGIQFTARGQKHWGRKVFCHYHVQDSRGDRIYSMVVSDSGPYITQEFSLALS